MTNSKNNCPIPFDQQPINEYIALKKSYIFYLSLENFKTFVLSFVSMFIFIFFLISSILLVFYYNLGLFKIFLLDMVISNSIIFLIFVRLYLGWSYLVKRLLSATVFYEESGWYDGQIWIKSSDDLIQDRLIASYQIMPFIVRIKYTCLMLVFILMLSLLILLTFQ